jgi:RimJ/RimL family protein N-acetyltransferase
VRVGQSDHIVVPVHQKKSAGVIKPMVLVSKRLLIRPFLAEDAATIAAYRCLPEVARFQSWESFDLADATQLISDQAMIVPDTPGTWLQMALVLTCSSSVIGDCGIHFLREDFRQAELGITLAPTYQGQGLATEAISAVLEYVFNRLPKHRVTAVTDAENCAAARLFRRLGFRQEAHHIENVWFKGAWGSEFEFAMLRHEWEQRSISQSG